MKAKRQIESSLYSVTMLDGTGGARQLEPMLTSPAIYSSAANTAGSFTTRQHSIWQG
jgi:hypothetical protein